MKRETLKGSVLLTAKKANDLFEFLQGCWLCKKTYIRRVLLILKKKKEKSHLFSYKIIMAIGSSLDPCQKNDLLESA